MSGTDTPKFLVIRRDNIGDLVCTTPLIASLRRHYPQSFIGALVNTYNRDVLAGNPDIDEVFAYTKAKHREEGESLPRVFAERLRLFLKLRRIGIDIAILATPGFQRHSLRFARLTRAKRVLGFVERPGEGRIELAVPAGAPGALHEAQDIYRLLAPLGITGKPPAAKVFADPQHLQRVRDAFSSRVGAARGPLVALHVSARRPAQRWPAESFADFARVLHRRFGAAFVLLWAPGSASNARHPGDDEKAQSLSQTLSGIPLLAYPTRSLGELIAALAFCDVVVCSDGGAMHLAAAFAKPIVCFFGDSPPERWHPWGAVHVVLQPETRHVAGISVDEAVQAFERLMKESGSGLYQVGLRSSV
jgi:heptosyltransferase III